MALRIGRMVTDAVLQRQIIARVIAARLGDQPAQPLHYLGQVDLPGLGSRALYARHAADAVITDRRFQVVLITRLHNPGAGLLALPGGFLDPVAGGVEPALDAAIREAGEEAGIDAALLRAAVLRRLGGRAFDRPFDIRIAWSDIAGTPIRQGDVFTVSTQWFGFLLPDLGAVRLQAGDDAKAVRVARISDLLPAQFAVPDHLPQIIAAAIEP